MNRYLIVALWYVLLVTSSVSPVAQAQAVFDYIIPEIELLERPTGRESDSLRFVAKVTDNNVIRLVSLHYRFGKTGSYASKEFKQSPGLSLYEVQLSKAATYVEDLSYYIVAEDLSGNRVFLGEEQAPRIIKIFNSGSIGLGSESTPDLVTETANSEIQQNSPKKYLYILLGVLAVGALASAAGGGSSSSADGTEPCGLTGCRLTITTPTISQ